MKTQAIIDRIEDKYAVVELSTRRTVNMPIELVPEGAREGDVLVISINREETASREENIENLMEEIWVDETPGESEKT